MDTNLADQSYEYLRQMLATGELSSGEQLVNRTLAAKIGVSVVPVREAINRLTNEGLVERISGAGAFVRRSDQQDLDNLYVLRDALESCAAGEAARYINEFQLEELETIVVDSRAVADQIDQQAKTHATKKQMNAWLDNEQRFHELLVEAARNPLLAKVTREHRAISQIFDAQRDDAQFLTADAALQTCAGKDKLIAALRAGDHQQCRELMSEQIQLGRKTVINHFRRTAKTRS